MFGWLRSKPDSFRTMISGMAGMVSGVRDMQPEWQRIEIRRTADGIEWAVIPPLPNRCLSSASKWRSVSIETQNDDAAHHADGPHGISVYI